MCIRLFCHIIDILPGHSVCTHPVDLVNLLSADLVDDVNETSLSAMLLVSE